MSERLKSIVDEFEEIGHQDLIIEKEKLIKKKSKKDKSTSKREKSTSKKEKSTIKKDKNELKKKKETEIECIIFDDSIDALDKSNSFGFELNSPDKQIESKETRTDKKSRSAEKRIRSADKKSDSNKTDSNLDLKENLNNSVNLESDDEKLNEELISQKDSVLKKLEDDASSYDSTIDLNVKKKKNKIIDDESSEDDDDKLANTKNTKEKNDKVKDNKVKDDRPKDTKVIDKVKDTKVKDDKLKDTKVIDKVKEDESTEKMTDKAMNETIEIIKEESKSAKKVAKTKEKETSQTTKSNNQINPIESTITDKSRPKRDLSKLHSETPEPLNKRRKCTMANDPLRFVKAVNTPPAIGLKLGLSRRTSIKSSLHPELFKQN